MKSNDTFKRIDFDHLWHPFTLQQVWFDNEPLIIDRAEGMELIDIEGKRYLDGVSSLWCNVHGHGVPELREALHAQVDKLCHSTLLGLTHVPVLELVEQLVPVLPPGLERVFFSDSGSAAVEAALRMAIEWWQRQGPTAAEKKTRFASLTEAYHGDTMGSVSIGYVEQFHRPLRGMLTPALRVDPPHVFRFYQGLSEDEALTRAIEQLTELFTAHHETLAAFVIEPLVQGAAGMWVQPAEYLQAVERLCRKFKVLLIADEIATGFGKVGTLFACERGQIRPDILTLGKGLSAGYLPISAAAATREIFEAFLGTSEEPQAFYYGQTFAGNPLAAAVSTANLKLIQSSRLLETLPARIAHFQRELNTKIAGLSAVREIRNCGVMTAIELHVPQETPRIPQQIVRAARKHGAFIRPLGDAMILMPPVAMQNAELSRLVEITAEAIREVIP